VCLGRATNNIAEYSVVIELLVDAISLEIHHLVVRLDSQLVVLQLSNIYSIRSPTLLRVYLRIRLLERYFDHIEYQHIPRCLNTLTDALANYVLDRHLNHL
jgi:ribonuclease HI